jgi:hypothetical protein
MRARDRTAFALAVVLGTIAAGCGGELPARLAGPAETAEALPDLQAGWRPYADARLGLALGVAPRWERGNTCFPGGHEAREATAANVLVLCSPDLLTTVSITADRGREALELPVAAFARRAFAALSERRYRGSLEAGHVRRPSGHYEAAAVTGRGEARGSRFRQRVTLIVLRRPGLVNYTAVIATNAERAPEREQHEAERMVRTVRDQPAAQSHR